MENALEKYRQLAAPVEGVANALATPYGYRAAQDFSNALAIAQYFLNTPVRVAKFVDYATQAGGGNPGFNHMDPYEVGQMASEAGTFPLAGAVGGAPRNAAGMVATSGNEVNPLKYAAVGGGLAGGGTVAVDSYNNEFPGLTVDYMTDRLGPNIGYGALAGGALGLGAAGLEMIADTVSEREKMRTFMKNQQSSAAWRSANGYPTTGQRGSTSPQGPSGSAPQAQTSGGQGPSSVPPRQGPASATPSAPQNTGNLPSNGSGPLSTPSGDYTAEHTFIARSELGPLFHDNNSYSATQIAQKLADAFRANGLNVPPSLQDRVNATLQNMTRVNPKLRVDMSDPNEVWRAMMASTGQPGMLGLAGLGAGLGASAAVDTDPALLEYLRLTNQY